MYITDNFTLEELLRSTTAARNHISQSEPPYSVVIALTKLCVNVLQPLREHYGEPLIISSGYRCPLVNKLVGGVHNSQHITGQAADIYLGGDSQKEAEYFRWIRKNLDFDQLILEGNQKSSWIHVSYNSPKLNRHQSWMQLQKTDGAS
jgi:hypothetical protein